MMKEGTIIYRPFMSILADAVFYARLAEQTEIDDSDPPVSYDHFSYSRASVLNSAFALESAANMCLVETEFPSSLKVRLEMLPTLDKFDLLLFVRNPKMKINRGESLIQMISELIELRNAYVHPKKKQEQSSMIRWDSANASMEKKQRFSQFLHLSKTLERCYRADALNSLQAVTTFLRWYFLDLSKLDPKASRHFLLSLVLHEGVYKGFVEDPHRALLEKAQKDWQIQVDFLLA